MIVHFQKRFVSVIGLAALLVCVTSLIPESAEKPAAPNPNGSVISRCNSGHQACVWGVNSTGGTGVRGESMYGFGVMGTTRADPGGFGPGSSAVYGRDQSPYGRTNAGVSGISTVGTGVYGHSIEGAGVFGNGEPGVVADGYTFGNGYWPGLVAIGGAPESSCDSNYPCPPAMAVTTNYAQGSGVTFFEAYDNAGTLLASIDDGGNMHLAGLLYTSGSCHSGCMPTRNVTNTTVVAYTPRQSSPTIEDFDEAQLTNGTAFVHINADFRATIDPASHYFVFVTPHGDSRGLYVTDETATGFWVRENGGGRTTMAFDYRIVAKPLDSNEPRLPVYRPGNLGKVPTSYARPPSPQG